MVRYFKKYDTRVPIYVGRGYAIPFEAIIDETTGKQYEWGLLQTSDGYVIDELGKLISQGVGGVAEISKADYEGLKKKLLQKLLPSWRETFSPSNLLRLYERWKRETLDAVVVNGNDPSVVQGLQRESWRLSRPKGVSDWRPTAIAR